MLRQRKSRAFRNSRLRFERLESRLVLSGDSLVISEFMAINNSALPDDQWDHPDWIEIHNPTLAAVDLDGWSLSDNPNNLTKWQFPPATINSDGYLVVFASAKDRVFPSGEIHTNFELNGDGEYLALVQGDGTVAHEYSPAFPQQFGDVSHGLTQASSTFALPEDTKPTYLVPQEGTLAATWTADDFDDSNWTSYGNESGVLITEAGTGTPDSFEVQNVSASEINTSGWVMAANNARFYDINDVHTPLWSFPESIDPREIVYRPDVSEDNIYWRTARDGWLVIIDAGGNVVDFVVWGYSAEELATLNISVNGFSGNPADAAWAGAPAPEGIIGDEALQRIGRSDHDNASDWTFGDDPTPNAENDNLTYPFVLDVATGVGFDAAGSGVGDAVQVDIEGAMYTVNSSVYMRVPFEMGLMSMLDTMHLRMSYNDGFVAYINGQEVARRNVPAIPQWDSAATAQRSVADSLQYEEIDLSDSIDLLQSGTNVLAIQGLNFEADDGDFLILPNLTGRGSRYFFSDTPGFPNTVGLDPYGPIISEITENPPPMTGAEDLVITATVTESFSSIAEVLLHYRVMFGSEVVVEMFDDGNGGDAVAGDGIYSAAIPAGVAGAGQMVRWYVTAADIGSYDWRAPLFLDSIDSPEYFGAIVENPSIDSQLPVLHWFIEDPAGADTWGGTRASVYYLDEFYDNIRVDLHGQSTSGFTKKSYDFDFNKSYRFEYAEGELRVKDFNLLTNWADKAKVRNTVAYEVHAQAGGPHHLAFPVRVQQNGQFFSVADWVEDGDDRFLERLGLDPYGALYKMYNWLQDVSGAQKKTRTYEGNADLQALINGAQLPFAERTAYLYDNISIPEVVNFFAATSIMDTTDMGHKNYYVYRDSDGTGEWQIFPWDVDLTFGHNWTQQWYYYDDAIYTQNPLYIGSFNVVMGALYNTPSIAEMYHRRMRTLMDEQLQAWNFEQRFDELLALVDPTNDPNPYLGSDDADLDYQKWGSWGNMNTMREDVARIKSEYFPARRSFLYNTQTVGNGGPIPAAQIDLAALPAEERNVDFGTIEFAPASGNQDEEYLEIINNNSFSLDISGWRLDGGVRFTFQSGTVIPSGGTLYVSPDVNAFRARPTGPSGGQGLFIQGGYEGHLSSFGETIELIDANDALIHSVTYEGDPTGPQQFLRISELMYNPPGPTPEELAAGFTDNDLFEFIELVNTGTEVFALDGVHFTQGITYTFSPTQLESGERILVVNNESAFEFRYGTALNVDGAFLSGKLNNGGEQIKLEDSQSGTILDFDYGDSNDAGWPDRADRGGSSLEVLDMGGNYDDPINWRSSSEYQGTPGEAGAGPLGSSIVINEVLSHTDMPLVDAIELHNTGPTEVAIGGWWLSDSSDDAWRFQIPAGTSIPADGYATFYEGHYAGNVLEFDQATEFGGPGVDDFALSGAYGDDVWLWKDDQDASPLRLVDHVDFEAAINGESFGRWLNSEGEDYFYPMQSRTFDRPNSGPRIGPELIISEVMYRPLDPGGGAILDELEFIEIFNPTTQPVDLTDWRLRRGLDFDFTPGTTLDPREALVVVSFDPGDAIKLADFHSCYAIGPEVQIVGGHPDRLGDIDDRVQLQDWDVSPPADPLYVPHTLEDEVDYLNTWYPNTDGLGESLHRGALDSFGNDRNGWVPALPTPGTAPLLEEPIVVGRYVFYNDSAWDSPAKGRTDDDAIATDKIPLTGGSTADFNNYTSYTGGLNGIMVDIYELGSPTTISADDFIFKVGNDDDPTGWSQAPAPSGFDVRTGEGRSGSDRITLAWNDNVIENQWLEVTVEANLRTGVSAEDVFYFGNTIGETGNLLDDAQVDALDILATRSNPHPFWDPALIFTEYDFNRDERVDAVDTLIVRSHQTWAMTELNLIDLSGSKSSQLVGPDVTQRSPTFTGPEGGTSSQPTSLSLNEAVTVWAHDAALEQSVTPSSDAHETPLWLYEFEQVTAKDLLSKKSSSAAAAVDKLLAIYGS